MARILTTGGRGFLGSRFVRYAIEQSAEVVDIDSLTYAADPNAHAGVKGYTHLEIDVVSAHPDRIARYGPYDAMVHFAAESHVDRSLGGPEATARTNVLGTCRMLEVARALAIPKVVYVSTDEVTGDLGFGTPPIEGIETDPMRPGSPYAASKAGAELLAHSYVRSFGTPVVIVRPSNCYGPRQTPEKFIPRAITRILSGRTAPLFGDGQQIRDWMHVLDATRGIWAAMERGTHGRVYSLSAEDPRTNRSVIEQIATALNGKIERVADRPGHDQRYEVVPKRAREELSWRAIVPWADGLKETIDWYVENEPWWRAAAKRVEAMW